MLLEIQLCFVFTILSCFVQGEDAVSKINTKQIIDTLQTEISFKYWTKLVELFAKKAAQSFINEIKNRKYRVPVPELKNEKNFNRVNVLYNKNNILSDEKAYKLSKEPEPDGDAPGWHSIELSEEDNYPKKNKGISIFGLTKVNGIYVRRLLGLLI